MQYERLDTSQQKQMLEQRLGQYEAEHFQHSVNKHLLEASGDTSEQTKQAIKAAEEAMVTLDHAHACCKHELVKLGGDEPAYVEPVPVEPEPAPPAPAEAAPARATRRKT